MELCNVHLFIFFCVLHCVITDVTFKELPSIMDATDGRNMQLTCTILSPDAGNYRVSWVIGSERVVNHERRYQVGNVLYFSPVKKDLDTEEMHCIATDKASGDEFASKPTQFNIKWMHAGGVELINPTDRRRIPSDLAGGIVMKCNITGNPKPNHFLWYVNGSVIASDDHIKLSRSWLNITSPRVGVNDGSYSCCATQRRHSRTLCTPTEKEFTLRVVYRRTPVLMRAPSHKVVKKGSDVFLDCLYESDPPPKIIWKSVKMNKELKNQTRNNRCKRCIYQNGTLALFNVEENQGGEYECIAVQDQIRTRPLSTTVSIAYIEKFREEKVEKFVLEGKKFEFNCEKPPALPEATISWMRARDNKIIDEDDHHVSRVMDTLVIHNVDSDVAGSYICSAANIAGSVSTNVTVALAVPPRFHDLDDQKTKEGETVIWVCPLIGGYPKPSVSWYKDDVGLFNITGKRMMYGVQMILYDVDMSAGGRYSCAAVSEVIGSTEQRSNSALLTITETFKFSPDLRDTCIAEGEPSAVDCRVTGEDGAIIRWSIPQNKTGAIHQKNGRISFSDPTRLDTGLYQCTASTTSLTINKTMYIDVIKRPQITVPPQNTTVLQGKRAMLDCKSSDPEQLQVTWRFRNQLYSRESANLPSHLVVLENGSLFINVAQKDDAGFYSCSYSRCRFKASAIVELSVADDSYEAHSVDSEQSPDDGSASLLVQTIALSVSGGIAYVLITVALIIYCRGKRRKKKKERCLQSEGERMLKDPPGNGNLRGNHDDEMVVVGNGVPMEKLTGLDAEMKNFLYPSNKINPVSVIGRGEFGDVFLSKAPGIFRDLEDDILVMVKAYDYPNDDEPHSAALTTEFIREINILQRTKHSNVVKLLGVCCKKSSQKPDHLITEYLEWGILKSCLEASGEEKLPKFTKDQKMNMCYQLACGLEHLTKLGLTHGDVATRNCVVSSQLLVKLSLLGLSKKGFENDYFKYNGKRMPIRWMAPEALFNDRHTYKSDVWSFAVACWEIFTLAETPFKSYNNEEYMNAFKSRQPPILPSLDDSKRITSLIRKCCLISSCERPDIKQIVRKLQTITRSVDVSENTSSTAKTVVSIEADDISSAEADS